MWTEVGDHCGLIWPPKLDGRGLPRGGEVGCPSGQDVVGPKARYWTSMKARCGRPRQGTLDGHLNAIRTATGSCVVAHKDFVAVHIPRYGRAKNGRPPLRGRKEKSATENSINLF